MIHQLKIDEEYFLAKRRGNKYWEVRLNDRGFKPGDYLALNETRAGKETGACILELITDVIRDAPGVRDGFVMLSTIGCEIRPDCRDFAVTVYGYRNRLTKGEEVEPERDTV